MNASFGCKGEIHLEVAEMFPSRRGSLSLGSKETSPSLSEFAGAFFFFRVVVKFFQILDQVYHSTVFSQVRQ